MPRLINGATRRKQYFLYLLDIRRVKISHVVKAFKLLPTTLYDKSPESKLSRLQCFLYKDADQSHIKS